MGNKKHFIDTYPSAVDFFDGWAEIGKDEGMERGHAASVDFMKTKIQQFLKKPFKFIDCGCGNGWVVRQYSKIQNCIQAVGVDGAEKMIIKANEVDVLNEYICADILNWKPQAKADIIHSMEVLYYLEDPAEFIKRIYEEWTTKLGCFIFGIDHYLENTASINWPEECGVNMNTQPISYWVDSMKNAGFKNVKFWQTGKKEDWEGTLVVLGNKK